MSRHKAYGLSPRDCLKTTLFQKWQRMVAPPGELTRSNGADHEPGGAAPGAAAAAPGQRARSLYPKSRRPVPPGRRLATARPAMSAPAARWRRGRTKTSQLSQAVILLKRPSYRTLIFMNRFVIVSVFLVCKIDFRYPKNSEIAVLRNVAILSDTQNCSGDKKKLFVFFAF